MAAKEKISGGDESVTKPIRVEKKIGRNEPCPCGSGKKYKECHGKSGPRKGVFAKENV